MEEQLGTQGAQHASRFSPLWNIIPNMSLWSSLILKKYLYLTNSVVQSYRNYSRIVKQYLYGNKEQEEIMQMALRSAFLIPFKCETPVELVKHSAVIYL